ncbi:storkhead-box protein 1 [Fukomys damarensis]|nr:storkhead-box protein 1 [Fukomys damarensis]XP_010604152.1 storkhead-box protein 1 [Fukomys damarensis]XP_010604160.1 storkhead-box protein 1 [Fukomys damarensis]XP_010604168.1 storkhead-box protein 1 [Fukomys damarensis]XP_033622448.1 storkhead-box protein 1 [Fukomys damarensis]
MNPIAQSRFVSLAEVLCCAISDMNTAQIVVTQETLLEHLKKHYPGIALPSQDILYTILGSLIKERKIYHTGEGYFIVTAQTYFITKPTAQEKKRALLSEGSPPGPTSVTYLVSMESCAELAKDNAVLVSHCQSCRCFPDMCSQDVEEPPPAAEMTRKGQKGFGESIPLVQNRAVSTSEENHLSDHPKTLPYPKDKEKGKKFGFSLLWRSISRKEKPRTECNSFSAQFPPEEWPVRDEDNLDNIPRDVEHEIIKRINPLLTIDNLIKHTLLMQKYEERKKHHNQGTSTDMLTVRPINPSKEGVKKRQGRSAKYCRRGFSHRERPKTQSRVNELQPGSLTLEKPPKLPVTQPVPQVKSANEAETQTGIQENPRVLGSQLIYKRRISNPFQGLSFRGSPVTKGHNIQKRSHLTPSQIAPKEKPFQRPSSEPPRLFDSEAQQPYPKQCHDKLKAEPIYMTKSSVQPISDYFRDGLLNYPQNSDLQSDSQCYSFRESMLRCEVYGTENKVIPEVTKKSPSHFDKLGEAKEALHGSSSLDPSSACRLVDKTIHQFQNLDLLDHSGGVNHLRQPERRQDRNSEELMRKTFFQESETASLENGELSDNDQALYQDEVEDDDGACSSLYLEEDDFSENDDLCQRQPCHIPYSFAGGSNCNHLGKPKVTEGFQTERNSKMDWFVPPVLKINEHCEPTVLLRNPGESQKPNLSAESCGLNSGTQFGFNCEEPSVATCVQALAPADQSLFDYYSTRKPNSEAEVPHPVVGDTGKKPSTWNQSPQNQEMRKHVTQKLELFNVSCMPVLAQDIQHEHQHLEGTENHSMAGDSGIDSPRTQSLASNNSVILDGLKRRRNFLQNFEDTKSNQTLTSNSLLQLTPVINV